VQHVGPRATPLSHAHVFRVRAALAPCLRLPVLAIGPVVAGFEKCQAMSMVGPEASGVLAQPILLLWRGFAGQTGGATSVEVGPSSQEAVGGSGYEPWQHSTSKRGYQMGAATQDPDLVRVTHVRELAHSRCLVDRDPVIEQAGSDSALPAAVVSAQVQAPAPKATLRDALDSSRRLRCLGRGRGCEVAGETRL